MSGFTKIDNRFIDKHMANLSGEAAKISWIVIRHSENNKTLNILIDQIKSLTNIQNDLEVISALNELVSVGLITYRASGDHYEITKEGVML